MREDKLRWFGHGWSWKREESETVRMVMPKNVGEKKTEKDVIACDR